MQRHMMAIPALFVLLLPVQAQAQISPGIGVGWGSETDFSLGGRAVVPFEAMDRGLRFIAGFDWFFPSTGFSIESGSGEDSLDFDYWELLAAVTMPVPVEGEAFEPYLGAGLHVGRSTSTWSSGGTTLEATDSAGGFTALGGLLYGVGEDRDYQPFVELRVNLADDSQFVVGAGVTF